MVRHMVGPVDLKDLLPVVVRGDAEDKVDLPRAVAEEADPEQTSNMSKPTS